VKRVEDVLRVFDQVRKKIPAKLLLIGDGPERNNIERLCRELGTCDDIKILGKLVNPEQHLVLGDIFLLPSETESFGLSALEAMASRVPVVSTDTGGIPEVNLHGITGFLSKVGEVDDMARNCLKLLNDDSLLERFRQQAFEQASRFDISRILPLYEQVYEEVLKRQHGLGA
jgi:N-acetyl-alpha-D-glucosaminyl L-malate synthase BshA